MFFIKIHKKIIFYMITYGAFDIKKRMRTPSARQKLF